MVTGVAKAMREAERRRRARRERRLRRSEGSLSGLPRRLPRRTPRSSPMRSGRDDRWRAQSEGFFGLCPKNTLRSARHGAERATARGAE